MNNKKILLVEDDEFLQQLYLDILSEENYLITTSSSGDDAFTKILAGGWDLVLLDVMLPKINGTEIMRQLKENPAFKKDYPIVFLTNMDGSAEINKIAQLVDDCWIKSNLTPLEVVQKVQALLTK